MVSTLFSFPENVRSFGGYGDNVVNDLDLDTLPVYEPIPSDGKLRGFTFGSISF